MPENGRYTRSQNRLEYRRSVYNLDLGDANPITPHSAIPVLAKGGQQDYCVYVGCNHKRSDAGLSLEQSASRMPKLLAF
jgi:hypothetical protein